MPNRSISPLRCRLRSHLGCFQFGTAGAAHAHQRLIKRLHTPIAGFQERRDLAFTQTGYWIPRRRRAPTFGMAFLVTGSADHLAPGAKSIPSALSPSNVVPFLNPIAFRTLLAPM